MSTACTKTVLDNSGMGFALQKLYIHLPYVKVVDHAFPPMNSGFLEHVHSTTYVGIPVKRVEQITNIHIDEEKQKVFGQILQS